MWDSLPSIVQAFKFLCKKFLAILKLPEFSKLKFRHFATVFAAFQRLHEVDSCLMGMVRLLVHFQIKLLFYAIISCCSTNSSKSTFGITLSLLEWQSLSPSLLLFISGVLSKIWSLLKSIRGCLMKHLLRLFQIMMENLSSSHLISSSCISLVGKAVFLGFLLLL